MAWNLPAAIVNAVDRTAAWFNAISDCFDALDQHDHSNVDGDGATLTGLYANQDNAFVPGVSYDASSGTVSKTNAVGEMFECYADNQTQNGYFEYTPYLRRGTYTLRVIYRVGTSRGIITLSFNGVAHGTTIDAYSGGAAANNVATITGIAFTATQTQTIRLSALTKNASSSGYVMQIQGLHLQRTGD
jgi:hypothetical protein